MSVFALGIMPYITASIIIQLLTVVIPRLETLKNEGQSGQAKITQYTRYLTIGLAILQSTGYVELARSGTLFPNCDVTTNPIIPNASVFTIATMVITMVAGTAVIMWMGELITDRGVGNGMSVMIFTQVIAVIPGELLTIFQTKQRLHRRPLGDRGASWSSRSWSLWNRRSGVSRSSTPNGWWAVGCTAARPPTSR